MKPNCKYCKDIPLWGCVSCPSSSRADKLQEKLYEKRERKLRERIIKKIKEIRNKCGSSYDSSAVAEILEELIEEKSVRITDRRVRKR